MEVRYTAPIPSLVTVPCNLPYGQTVLLTFCNTLTLDQLHIRAAEFNYSFIERKVTSVVLFAAILYPFCTVEFIEEIHVF